MRKYGILATKGLAPQIHIPEWKIFLVHGFPMSHICCQSEIITDRIHIISGQTIQLIEKGPT